MCHALLKALAWHGLYCALILACTYSHPSQEDGTLEHILSDHGVLQAMLAPISGEVRGPSGSCQWEEVGQASGLWSGAEGMHQCEHGGAF